MKKAFFFLFFIVLFGSVRGQDVHTMKCEQVYPGIWRYSIGKPDAVTPSTVRYKEPAADVLDRMGGPVASPVEPQAEVNDRGVLVSVPLSSDEAIYGLGLQELSFEQRGKKKIVRVNADPRVDTGDSHAPVPFYVTTGGYGVYVDNARYMTFYFGGKVRRPTSPSGVARKQDEEFLTPFNGAYSAGEGNEVFIEIPRSEGVDIYVFAGPTMKEAVARYNLFAGGGCLPPRWGLGFWYRVRNIFHQDKVEAFAKIMQDNRIPCDVFGLEPGWQQHSYSSTYTWRDTLYPDPKGLVKRLGEKNIKVNLWTQGYVHPDCPIYNDLLQYSGDFQVWDGIAPNFFIPEARRLFVEHHAKETVGIGTMGFKADECDNSDYTGNWSFPEISRFPGGIDGEQMHNLFGLSLQQTMMEVLNATGKRTLNLVRSSGALASPLPFVLYSDLYDHQGYINGIGYCGFSGLLWCPEVRSASSEEDLVRRMQSVICSPVAMINAWNLALPPWMQMNHELNLQEVIDPDNARLMALCRNAIELRMRFIPYLHAAFVKYYREGIPPFRALIMDYPDEKDAVKDIAGQYMMGDDIMVAPVVASGKGVTAKKIYFPKGTWYDFFTGERIEGGQTLELSFELERIPLYVKEGTILPLARVTLSADDPASREIEPVAFGDNPKPAVIYEDDGTLNPSLKENVITWDARKKKFSLKSSFYKLAK